MQSEAPTRPDLLDRFADLAGRLTPEASLVLNAIWRNTAPGYPVVPCVASTSTNNITLTPILTDEGAKNLANHMAFSFVADATLSGSGTITIGSLGPYKAYINGGSVQAGSGDVIDDRAYLGIFNEALDGGAGGVVLIGAFSGFAHTLLDDANAGAALTTLGVSSAWQTILAQTTRPAPIPRR